MHYFQGSREHRPHPRGPQQPRHICALYQCVKNVPLCVVINSSIKLLLVYQEKRRLVIVLGSYLSGI